MNDIVVFCGSTLQREACLALLPEATCKGPVVLGDVYRAVEAKAWAIAIIDGAFDQQMAVWHKEVLWAIAHRVRVYGAASMGALRAAELSAFGMIGVGKIFEAFQAGIWEDDDEVAVSHRTVDGEFVPLSEAMVNIRGTVQLALEAGVLGVDTASKLIASGKELFYADRTFPAVIAGARHKGAPESVLSDFESWLGPARRSRIDQKRLDAQALLQRVRADRLASTPAIKPRFNFEYTDAWHALRLELDGKGSGSR